jgi:hypothetical protein
MHLEGIAIGVGVEPNEMLRQMPIVNSLTLCNGSF